MRAPRERRSEPTGPLPIGAGQDALAAEAVRVMNTYEITGLFVADGARPVGILHIHDCLRAGIS